MKNHSFFTNNKAVTPVIGEILLIAVIVIIAAVIGSHVYEGTDEKINVKSIVGTHAQQIDSNTIKITYIASKEPNILMYLNVSINGNFYANGNWSTKELNTFNGNGTKPLEPGTVVYIDDNTSTHITSTRNTVLIVAGFIDGTKQVVLDTPV